VTDPRRWAAIAAVLAAGLPRPIPAQARTDPRLIFSVYGGIAAHGNLWRIERQPIIPVFGTTAQWDTLRLQRNVSSGFNVGLNATLFRSAHLGYTAEAQYLSLGLDDTCGPIYLVTDAQERDRQICDNISAASRTASVAAFTLGGVFRFSARSAFVPYLRATGGITVRSSSVLFVAGAFQQTDPTSGQVIVNQRIVIDDPPGTAVNPTVSAGLGFMATIAPGYQLRVELRDHLLFLERPTGPANDAGMVQSELITQHAPAIVMGFDIVLEQRRGRRY
jgi:hypothetical protein